MSKVKAGIAGSAGYAGGELLRLLVDHPDVEIIFAHSKSNAGNPVASVHEDLFGVLPLHFTNELAEDIDVLFLCVGHGAAKAFLQENPQPDHVKIIDLSQDYRIAASDHYFIYGLPELQREAIKKAQNIANPGCFATCIQLGLLPLAQAGILHDDVHINAITGSTGAGQKPSSTSHFSWRNNNVSAYKIFEHQHLAEINQSLVHLQPSFAQKLRFVPVRGDFTRGIFSTMYTICEGTLEQLLNLYQEFYATSPFVFIAEKNPSLKQVVNTNKGIIYLEKHDDTLVIISMIDNLLKGASGQAVQNMNLMFGLPENAGLRLKSTVF